MPNPRFCIEAKRLYRSNSVAEYIDDEGLGAFIGGYYGEGLFFETHPDPDHALSDGPNMIPLAQMPKLLAGLLKIHAAVR